MKCRCDKYFPETRIKRVVQLRKHCYRRNKPDTGQSSGPRWTFFFCSRN